MWNDAWATPSVTRKRSISGCYGCRTQKLRIAEKIPSAPLISVTLSRVFLALSFYSALRTFPSSISVFIISTMIREIPGERFRFQRRPPLCNDLPGRSSILLYIPYVTFTMGSKEARNGRPVAGKPDHPTSGRATKSNLSSLFRYHNFSLRSLRCDYVIHHHDLEKL